LKRWQKLGSFGFQGLVCVTAKPNVPNVR